ncbi:MAG: hypothetical protein ACE5JD_15730 [Candidatus Methylomirabilia bacterium]
MSDDIIHIGRWRAFWHAAADRAERDMPEGVAEVWRAIAELETDAGIRDPRDSSRIVELLRELELQALIAVGAGIVGALDGALERWKDHPEEKNPEAGRALLRMGTPLQIELQQRQS